MKSIIRFAMVIVCILCCCLAQSDEINLRSCIAEIRKESSDSQDKNCENIETQLLRLLENEKYKNNKGVIFAALAKFCSEDLVKHEVKVSYYASEALKYELDIEETCLMYICLGDVEFSKKDSHNPYDDDMIRKNLLFYLKGLSFVLENLHVEDYQNLPRIDKYHVEPGDPLYNDAVLKHEKQTIERAYIERQNLLVEYRDYFDYRVKEVLMLSKTEPADIQRFTEQVLSKSEYEKVVAYLTRKTTSSDHGK